MHSKCPAGRKPCQHDSAHRILLTQIINLHNTDGIQDLSRIRSMLSDLKTGKDLFMENGLPNIKIVITKNGFILKNGQIIIYVS